jgi:hypothetical protein
MIVMNKCDILLTEDEHERFRLISDLGYRTMAVSAKTGETWICFRRRWPDPLWRSSARAGGQVYVDQPSLEATGSSGSVKCRRSSIAGGILPTIR